MRRSEQPHPRRTVRLRAPLRLPKRPETGANYSIDSKGSTLPIIAIPSPKGDGTYDQDESGQELAQGLDVTLVLRTYKPKDFNNRGLALEQVIVHEEPRYYNRRRRRPG